MTIENLGVKLYSGTKADRKSDSLGSSADGTNTGITRTGGKIARPSGASWDFTNILYDGKSYDVSSKENQPATCTFKTDGTKFYVVGEQNATIYEFTCSTAWDISTASYTTSKALQKTSGYGGNTPQNCGIAFKSDGLKCFVCERNDETIHEYALSSAWDISTLNTTHTDGFSVSSQTSNPRGVWVNSDGTKFYVPSTMNEGSSNDTVFQYTCSTGWDLTTASYASKSKDYSSKIANGVDFAFNNDGTKCYVLNLNDDGVFQFTVDTAYDVTTIDLATSEFLNTNAQDSTPLGFYIEPTQKKIFVVGLGNDKVSQYSDAYYGAYSFDGTDDKVAVSSASTYAFLNDKSSDWTIAWWHKNTKGTISSHGQMLFATSDNGGSADGFYCDLRSGNGLRAGFQGSNGSAGGNATWSGVVPTDATVWTHFALVCDVSESKLALYKNGTLVSNESVSWSAGYDSDFPLNIGCRVDTQFLQCDLDDIGIYKRVLSATEIGKLANNNGAGWLTKDAQATTNTSSSGTTLTNSSFTVANNSNRILIVCAYRYGSGGDISGITWNGTESFTRATFRDGSTETGRTEIWYLVNPTATTANVVTTWDASTDRRIAGVYSFYNAKQTSPIGATAYDDEITTVTDGAITPTEEGSMIVDCIGSGSNGAPNDSLTAGWSVLIGGDDRIGASQYKVNPTIGSANTMAWTFASDKGVNWIAVEVKSANPTGSSAQLVSSLTNKSNLKAYYSMDSTSLGATLSWEETFDESQSDGEADYDSSSTSGTNHFVYDATNDEIDFSVKRDNTARQGMTKDISSSSNGVGSVLSDSKWLLRFTIDIDSWGAGGDATTAIGLTDFTRQTASNDLNYAGDSFQIRYNSASTAQCRIGWGNNEQGDQNYHNLVTGGSDLADNKTHCWEVSRDGTSLKFSRWNDTFTGSPSETHTFTVDSDLFQGGDAPKYFAMWSGGGTAGGNAMTGSITNIKIYNGVSALDGCKNDFSTTSDLEALSGVRTNSIFQQTDDTPSYWWYNGTSWVLDGTTGVIPTDSSTGWTFKNASNSSETSNDYIKIENGKLTFNDASGQLSYRYAYYDLGSVSDTAWVLRFKWDITTYTKGTSSGYEDGCGIGLQSEAVNGFYESATSTQATTDAFWFASFFSNAEAWTGGNYANEQSIYSGTDVKNIKSPNNMLSTGTYYIEIARTGAGTGTVKCFTGSDYSTGQVGSTCDLVGTNISNLKYLVAFTGSDSGANGVLTSTISDIKFLNNVSEWLE